MTNSEKATCLINSAVTKLSRGKAVDSLSGITPVTWYISGYHWDKAIDGIDEAIRELEQAKSELQELVG